ncbi:MAG: hypothetical protein WAO35_08520 [Terriglobia bacterium]
MVKKTVQGLMMLSALLWSTGGAQARDLFKDMQMDVFVLGGGSTLIDSHYFPGASSLYYSHFELGPKFSVGAAVPYGKYLNIETAYSYGPNNFVVTDDNEFPHKGVVYPVRVYIGSISGVFHSPATIFHLRPYAEAGVEFDRFSPTPAAVAEAYDHGFASVSTAIITHNDKFGLNLGGGLDRKLTKRLTFRIDLRDHVTSSPAFGIPPIPTPDNLAVFPAKGRANNIEYTAGIIFHIGKL